MKQRIALEIISFMFIVLFMYAAGSKILDYEKFRIQVGQSPMLTGFGEFIPGLVIGAEVIVSLLFMHVRLRRVAMYVAFCLMAMFTVYIIAILKLSPYVPCSCGGILEDFTWKEHLVFNVVFLLLSGAGTLLDTQAGVNPSQQPLT